MLSSELCSVTAIYVTPFRVRLKFYCGRGSSIGIAIGYGRTVRGSNPGWGEIFRTCPDRPWDPPSLLYNGYRVFPGGKAAGRGAYHPPLEQNQFYPDPAS